MISIVVSCIGNKFLIIIVQCIVFKWLMVSIVVQWIGNKRIIFSIVVQCIGNKLLMISIVVHCIAYVKHRCAMHWN